ncbi:MAG: hypothetical protein CMJ78_02510 [Planctomycetaceae bacterium]|nr:hypothetical protein [Planctomycetaceae bacterium]
MQNVRHGRPYLSRSVQKDVSIIGGRFQLIATSPFDALTPGELALFLAFFVEGLPGKAAAELLDMSRPAEFSSWYRMYTRLGVHDRFEGFMLAREYFSLDD